MKYNIILISVLIFLLPVFLFADKDDDIEAEISLLLEESLEENYNEILSLSGLIEYGTAYKIYVLNQKELYLPLLLNSAAGFGIGSFVQGDKQGGLTLLFGDILFAGVILFSEFMIEYNTSMAPEIENTVYFCYLGGFTGLVILRIYEIIRPIKFGKSYNKRLYSALKLERKSNEDSVSIRGSIKRPRISSYKKN